jgi:predicted ATPase/class 3 adenylate cyclase
VSAPVQAEALTFLFTDVEGSTRLWEALPNEMPEALATHFRALEHAIESEGGAVVKETGDGLFATFAAADAAIRATVTAQRTLAATSWGSTGPLLVRMGLHTGSAIREHDDYHGTDVNRCARLMATAHGGQVLVSEATYALVRDDAPAAVSFIDLGEHRLKDLARSERIHQLVHPDLRADFPPLRSLGTFPNNLPAALSSFVGRTQELAAVQEALGRSRLVTLTGAGGAGKTRLALQAAADRVERHPDGVWLVDLAGLSDPELVAQTALSALRIPELPDRPALEALTGNLAARDLLIVLDNCEHLIAASAQLVDAALRAASKVRVIATSREPLNVPGEISWRVPSLSLPTPDGDVGVDESEALTLFVERARDADPSFALTPERRALVVSICRRLDGLPLAIELAAARVRALSVEEIAARLQDRFALLTGGARTALPRQRTLEAAVAWSYDLLDPEERTLFARLSIFAGTFDLAAVEEVCSGSGIERGEIVDLLARLVDKSLVSVVHLAGGSRYRLLETLRDYARNRLAASADAQVLAEAHTRWAVGYAVAAGGRIFGPQQTLVLAEIAAAMDDLRAALARCLESGDPETGLRIMVGLRDLWPIGGVREARIWLDQLLADTGSVSPAILGQGLSLQGVILAIHGLADAAIDAQERALALLREVGDERGAAWATHLLAIALWHSAPPSRVKQLTLEALAEFTKSNDLIGIVRCHWWLVLWELEFGTVEEALGHGEALSRFAGQLPIPIARAHAAEAAGLLARVQGDLDEAGRQLREAVGWHAQIRNVMCLSHCLEHVALWSLDRDEPDQAATLLGAVDAIREDVVGNASVPGFERMWHERGTDAARAALGEAAYTDAWRRGRSMTVDEAIVAGRRAVGLDAATEPGSG